MSQARQNIHKRGVKYEYILKRINKNVSKHKTKITVTLRKIAIIFNGAVMRDVTRCNFIRLMRQTLPPPFQYEDKGNKIFLQNLSKFLLRYTALPYKLLLHQSN
jgi:hypothetical protein